MKQLVFVVESTRMANTDGKYIKVILDSYYDTKDLKLSFVYMDGKGNFCKKSISTKVDGLIKKFQGETTVIYVVDKDLEFRKKEDEKLNLEIARYCESKGCLLIWFVHKVENVFWEKECREERQG